MIRIAVIDDHLVVLAGIKALLTRKYGMEVVATSDNPAEAVEIVRQHRPDVLLLDIRMPGISGLEVLDTVLAAEPDTQVAMLTTSELEEDVYRAMTHGARGFIRKDARGAELINGVRTVAAGEKYLPEPIRRIYEARKSAKGLTEREVAILRYIAKGLSYHEIGEQYNISVNTVKIHVRHIFEKLDVSDRTEAVTLAIARGIIEG